MTAPERAENPTEGTAGLLAAHEYTLGQSKRNAICSCGFVPDVNPESLWSQQDYHRAHLAAVLDAHVTERCAETLEEAATTFQVNTWADVIIPALKTKGIPALAVGQAVVDWLRDRAAALVRDTEEEADSS